MQNVFAAMQPKLARVEARLLSAAHVNFPMVSNMLTAIVAGGGKRLRPILLMLAADAFNQETDDAIPAAAGVELLHTASLIHDDSIDKAAIRRGTPTLNTELSTGAVVLIGDFLFAQSAILAAEPENPRVMVIFAKTLAEICEGQIRETLDAHDLDQSMEAYEGRIYGKTAALFAGAAEMGAVLGGGTEPHIQALRQFGSDLGMAFQIVDDVLDLRESTETLGKPAGNDLRQGVVTVPVMEFARTLAADDPVRETIRGIITGTMSDDETVSGVVTRIRKSGALEAAETIANRFAESARARVADLPNTDVVRWLNELVDLSVVRRS